MSLPSEADKLIEEIMRDSDANAPHNPDVVINLTADTRNSDLKRVMKPQIDELLARTKEALLKGK